MSHIKSIIESAESRGVKYALSRDGKAIAYPVEVGQTITSYNPIRVDVLTEGFSSSTIDAVKKAAMMTDTRCAYCNQYYLFLFDQDHQQWLKRREFSKESDYPGATSSSGRVGRSLTLNVKS